MSRGMFCISFSDGQGFGLHGPIISQQLFIDYWKIFLDLWFSFQVSLSCGQTGHLPRNLARSSLHDLYFQWTQATARDTSAGPPTGRVQVAPYTRAPGREVGPEAQSKLCSPSSLLWCGAVSAGRKGCLVLTGTKAPGGLAVTLFKPLGFLLWGLVSRVCLHLLCSSQSAFVLTNIY